MELPQHTVLQTYLFLLILLFFCMVALTNLIGKYNLECTFCKVIPFNSKLDILSTFTTVKNIKQSRMKLLTFVKLATGSRI